MAATGFSHVEHNLPSDGVFSASATTISAIVAIPSSGVAFVGDERLIIMAISIMVLTGITLVRILIVMVLALDSLLDIILGNKAIVLGPPCLGTGVAPTSHPPSPKLVALQQLPPVMASPWLNTSSRPGSNLANSPTCLPIVSPPALNLVINLSYFDLQQVSGSGVSESPSLAPRQHTMVHRPRKAKTTNISVSTALESSSSPTHESSIF
uniref:Uncharacterized protein n=1 Tax=Populus alba TaxID=43335 RepID=A0A4U5P447_POPAL|nr:hypothetical protein D5086_0000228120 [Populus alba]